MENYRNEGYSLTPKVNFDLINGLFEIKGRSIPENSFEFYSHLVNAIDKYSVSVKPFTNVTIHLEYFNTSSSKCILDLLKRFEKIHKNGNTVTINWNYEEEDEDMLQAGKDYQAIINIPFKMIQVTD